MFSDFEQPAVIAIYNTREGGEALLQQSLHQALAGLSYYPLIQSRFITAEDIHKDFLRQKQILGLILPGRNHGSDYRRELGDKGFKTILDSTNNGLHVMAICAGSYVLSSQTIWHSKYGGSHAAVHSSAYPLFQGVSEGAIHELWEESYFEELPDGQTFSPLLHRQGYLPASIVNVSFNGLINEEKTREFAVLYGGGGRFHAFHPETITTLLTHQETADKTAAIVCFPCGQGLVTLSNVHPEVDSRLVKAVFQNSAKAMQNPQRFQAALTALEQSTKSRLAIFQTFLDNCLHGKNHVFPKIAAQDFATII